MKQKAEGDRQAEPQAGQEEQRAEEERAEQCPATTRVKVKKQLTKKETPASLQRRGVLTRQPETGSPPTSTPTGPASVQAEARAAQQQQQQLQQHERTGEVAEPN